MTARARIFTAAAVAVAIDLMLSGVSLAASPKEAVQGLEANAGERVLTGTVERLDARAGTVTIDGILFRLPLASTSRPSSPKGSAATRVAERVNVRFAVRRSELEGPTPMIVRILPIPD